MILSIKEEWLPFWDRVDRGKLSETESKAIKAEQEKNAEILTAMAEDNYDHGGNVAVLPLFGVLSQHGSWFSTSTELFGRAFDKMVASSRIGGIVINIHSPGGQHWGSEELSNKIFEARNEKPIVGISNAMSASAAYYTGSAVKEFVVTPSGEAGYIGTYAYRYEDNGAVEKAGYKLKVYAVPQKKGEVAGILPTSEETDQEILDEVSTCYEQFVAAVARNRGKSVKYVKEHFGGGGGQLAMAAVESGMADRVATLDEVVRDLSAKVNRKRGRHSSANERQIDLAKV